MQAPWCGGNLEAATSALARHSRRAGVQPPKSGASSILPLCQRWVGVTSRGLEASESSFENSLVHGRGESQFSEIRKRIPMGFNHAAKGRPKGHPGKRTETTPTLKGLNPSSLNVVSKAKTACEITEPNIVDHFADVGKMITTANPAQREVD